MKVKCFLTAQVVSLLIRTKHSDNCWILHAATNTQRAKTRLLTSKHLKYKLKHNLLLTYVSSRCCSRVDSIIINANNCKIQVWFG